MLETTVNTGKCQRVRGGDEVSIGVLTGIDVCVDAQRKGLQTAVTLAAAPCRRQTRARCGPALHAFLESRSTTTNAALVRTARYS